MARVFGYERFPGGDEFRQDLGKFAWGFNLSGNAAGAFYRQNEIDRNQSAPPYVTAFAEYRPDRRTTLKLSVDNLTGTPAARERTFFFPDRRTTTPSQFEFRHRNRHIVPAISFKRSIG